MIRTYTEVPADEAIQFVSQYRLPGYSQRTRIFLTACLSHKLVKVVDDGDKRWHYQFTGDMADGMVLVAPVDTFDLWFNPLDRALQWSILAKIEAFDAPAYWMCSICMIPDTHITYQDRTALLKAIYNGQAIYAYDSGDQYYLWFDGRWDGEPGGSSDRHREELLSNQTRVRC